MSKIVPTASHDVTECLCSKHLECERDELRNQVEELCRMKTSVEEYVSVCNYLVEIETGHFL